MSYRYNPVGSTHPFTYRTVTSYYIPSRKEKRKVKKDIKELLVLTVVLAGIVLWVVGVSALVGLS